MFITVLLLSCINVLPAQKTTKISSPDKQLVFTFESASGHPQYSVIYKNKHLVGNSTLGLTFTGNDFFGNDIQTGRTVFSDGVDDYVLPLGKASEVHDTYKEAMISLQERKGKRRLIVLRVRVFNDGIGFRYEFPQQEGWQNYILTDENTSFNLSGNPTSRVAFLENFTTSHEHRYNVVRLKQIINDTLIETPALFEFP
jgi:alpha-glucosidase